MNWVWRQRYRQYRLLTWMQHAAARRLTPAGWLVGLCLGLAAFMGINHQSMVAHQGIALLLFLLVSATVPSFFFRVKLSVTRSVPRFGTAGQPLSYRIVVRNLTAKTQADLFLLEDLTDTRPPFQEWLAYRKAEQRNVRPFWLAGQSLAFAPAVARVRPVALPTLAPGRELDAEGQITPLRRGLLTFAGVSVARPDPFGLFHAIVKFPLPGKILILPRRYPLPPLAMPGTLKYQEGGVALAANVGQSDEFVALRDYRRGDPLRHIHWRSWARTGKPIVKEFEDEFFVRHALVLDTFSDQPNSELFEEAVSVAASFACTLQTQESLLDLLFVGAEAYCFTAGRGLAHADQMLEILAAVRPAAGQTLADLERLVFNHTALVSNCICVLLAWDAPRRDFVKKLVTSGVPVLVVVLVAQTPAQPLDPGPLRDEPGRFHTLVLGEIEAGLQAL